MGPAFLLYHLPKLSNAELPSEMEFRIPKLFKTSHRLEQLVLVQVPPASWLSARDIALEVGLHDIPPLPIHTARSAWKLNMVSRHCATISTTNSHDSNFNVPKISGTRLIQQITKWCQMGVLGLRLDRSPQHVSTHFLVTPQKRKQ